MNYRAYLNRLAKVEAKFPEPTPDPAAERERRVIATELENLHALMADPVRRALVMQATAAWCRDQDFVTAQQLWQQACGLLDSQHHSSHNQVTNQGGST